MFSDLWKSRSLQLSDLWYDSRMRGGEGTTELEKSPDETTEQQEHLPAATPIPDSAMLPNSSAIHHVDHVPQDSTPNRPSKSPKTRRSTTPRSESAIRDGRKYLSAYRQHKRSKTPGNSNGASGKRPVNGAAGQGVIESLDVPPGLVDAFTERVGIYHSCAPGLARSLEAALNASVDRQGARGKLPDENFPKDVGGSASVTSLGATAGSSHPSVSSSPERMTPEVGNTWSGVRHHNRVESDEDESSMTDLDEMAGSWGTGSRWSLLLLEDTRQTPTSKGRDGSNRVSKFIMRPGLRALSWRYDFSGGCDSLRLGSRLGGTGWVSPRPARRDLAGLVKNGTEPQPFHHCVP